MDMHGETESSLTCMEKQSNHGRAWRNGVIMDVHGETKSSWTCMEKQRHHGRA